MHAITDQLVPDHIVKTCFCHVALIVYLVYLGVNKELFCSVLFCSLKQRMPTGVHLE